MATPSPAIPTFTDGVVVHQADLNALGTNLTNLYNYNQAGFFTQRPTVLAKQTTTQSIAASTNTLINFDTAVINTDTMWVASVANQVTIQHAGIYFMFGELRFPGQTGATLANYFAVDILVNGTTPGTNSICYTAGPMLNITSALPLGFQAFGCANLAAGATVYLNVSHNSGGAISTQVDRGNSFLGAVFLTPSS